MEPCAGAIMTRHTSSQVVKFDLNIMKIKTIRVIDYEIEDIHDYDELEP